MGAEEIEGRREFYLARLQRAEEQIANATNPEVRKEWQKIAAVYRIQLRTINFKADLD